MWAWRLFQQHVLEELDRARIVRLTQPEHRLLPDRGVPVVLRDLDQLRHAFVLRQLAQREDRAFADVSVRILLNREAVRRGIPLVDCAMFDLEAQLTTILPGRTPCLACLYPTEPPLWKREFPTTFGQLGRL